MFKLEEPEIETEQSQPAGFVKRRPPAALLLMVRGQEVTPLNNRVELTESVTIGRERPGDLTLDDPCISAVHFRIILNDGRASIEDLGSTNGTFINGLRIEGRFPLADGALIRAGRRPAEAVPLEDSPAPTSEEPAETIAEENEEPVPEPLTAPHPLLAEAG